MADRPILFSGPMVRALLEGRKSQTRRIVPGAPTGGGWFCDRVAGGGLRFVAAEGAPSMPVRMQFALGDRLWVREAWHAARSLDSVRPRDIPRDADIEHACTARGYAEIGLKGKLRPSMFMPRWASRLTLVVIEVRVERLQNISEADAIAEGIGRAPGGWFSGAEGQASPSAVGAYALLWNAINARRGFGWETNPWVVAVTFTVNHQNIDALGAQEAA